MKLKVLIAGAAVLAILTGGAFVGASVFFLSPSEDRALALVPRNAAVYMNVFIKPSTDQKMAISDLLDRFPQAGKDFEEAKDALVGLLQPELDKVGLNYEADVEPWLGDQVALYMTAPEVAVGELGAPEAPDFEGAFLIRATDEAAATAAIDKGLDAENQQPEGQTYKGVDYRAIGLTTPDETAFGFVEDFLVVGSVKGFEGVVDAKVGETLADNEAFSKPLSTLEDDRFALLYVDTFALSLPSLATTGVEPDAAGSMEQLRTSGFLNPTLLSLHFEKDAAVLEAALALPEGGAYEKLLEEATESEGLLGSLPGDSWLAVGVANLGESIESGLDLALDLVPDAEQIDPEGSFKTATGLDLREDVLSWMGDMGLFVHGTTVQNIRGGLVIESSDAAKTEGAVGRLEQYINGEQPGLAGPAEQGDLRGFSLTGPGFPDRVSVLGGDRFVAAIGDRAISEAVEPTATLEDSEPYQRALEALGEGFTPNVYADLTPIMTFVDVGLSFSGAATPDYQSNIKPALQTLDFGILGTKADDGVLTQRFVVGVKPGGEE